MSLETEYTYALTACEDGTYRVYGTSIGVEHGHKFCFGCCDMRRAVIDVNLINIVVTVIGKALALLILLDAQNPSTEGINASCYAIFSVCINVLGIYGAKKLNTYLVGICGAHYVMTAVFYGVRAANDPPPNLHVYRLIYYGLFAYPHFFFLRQMQNGIISAEDNGGREPVVFCPGF